MEKELRELLAKLRKEYSEMRDSASVEELEAKVNEIRETRTKLDLELEMRANDLPPTAEVEEQREMHEEIEVRDMTEEQVDEEYEGVFLRAFRGKNLSERDLTIFDRMKELRAAPVGVNYLKTAVDADGGLIVPKKVSTMINEYIRQGEFNLQTLIDVEMTTVISGTFVYEKLSTMKPFELVEQWADIKDIDAPQFESKSYAIKDYAGILPLPRTLLQDTDQNLLSHIAKWIAKKTIVTRNTKILAVLKATYTSTKAVATIDDLKDVLDIELDPAFANGASIVTNQHGYNFLRKLKDSDGNYLLQADVTQPDRKVIDGKPVVVIPTRTLPNNAKKVPLFVGQLKEAVRLFDRGVYEIESTTVGGDAFKRNSLDTRVIDRFDVISLDKEAVVACEITLP